MSVHGADIALFLFYAIVPMNLTFPMNEILKGDRAMRDAAINRMAKNKPEGSSVIEVSNADLNELQKAYSSPEAVAERKKMVEAQQVEMKATAARAKENRAAVNSRRLDSIAEAMQEEEAEEEKAKANFGKTYDDVVAEAEEDAAFDKLKADTAPIFEKGLAEEDEKGQEAAA